MRRLGSGTGWKRLAVAAALVALVSAPGTALCQSLQEQIVGTWRLVSAYTEQGGVTRHLHGEKPVGVAVYDRSG